MRSAKSLRDGAFFYRNFCSHRQLYVTAEAVNLGADLAIEFNQLADFIVVATLACDIVYSDACFDYDMTSFELQRSRSFARQTMETVKLNLKKLINSICKEMMKMKVTIGKVSDLMTTTR